jgi:hypothetical protein
MSHIRDKLPDMKARLNTLMGQAQQELDTFGDEAIYGDTNQVFLSAPRLSSSLIAMSCQTARWTRPPAHDSICPRLCHVYRGYKR